MENARPLIEPYVQFSHIRLSVWKFVFIAPVPRTFQYRFTLVTTASFNLDKQFAARHIICGLPPLTALSGNIFRLFVHDCGYSFAA